jgi:hypothetical protein
VTTAPHPRSWVVGVSADGASWTEVDHREHNSELNRSNAARTFAVRRREAGRIVGLVNIGRNHRGDDCLCISAFEIFGDLIGPIDGTESKAAGVDIVTIARIKGTNRWGFPRSERPFALFGRISGVESVRIEMSNQ